MNEQSRARTAAQDRAATLIELSHHIHATPELAFQEFKSSRLVADALTRCGFDVAMGACGLPTAFTAQRGSGSLHVGICAEYDALPGIGHACGHNVIAAASVGAAIALAEVADDLDRTVHVLGTPAEEDGGGKILMLEQGAFDGLHFAMMVHPAPFDVAAPRLIAASTFDVRYRGRAAHASAFPELGVNAADALTVAQVAIGLLRQHLPSDDRVHGIVTHGGEAPNIVPAQTAARFTIRSATAEQLETLRARIVPCFEAGALATGASLEIESGSRPYAEVVHDRELATLYRRHAVGLGRTFVDSGPAVERAAASTDMGNVSRALPSLHPLIGIDSFPAVNHQPEFTAHCVRPPADRAIVDGAIAMALTAIDAATTASIRTRLTFPTRAR